MEKKPLIGVVPLWDETKKSIWMIPGYLGGIEQAGGIPLTLPLTDDEEDLSRLINICDGFLFTGGQDVDPTVYGEARLPVCGEKCEIRDSMEAAMLSMILAADKPLLGICRGIQFITAALGGSLYQDIPTQRPSDLVHCQRPPYHLPSHGVSILPSTPLYELLGTEKLAVNSYHHQGVKRVPACLRVMAEADDGLTEGVYMPDKRFVWAIQWHPELSYRQEESSRKIFRALVSASAQGRIF